MHARVEATFLSRSRSLSGHTTLLMAGLPYPMHQLSLRCHHHHLCHAVARTKMPPRAPLFHCYPSSNGGSRWPFSASPSLSLHCLLIISPSSSSLRTNTSTKHSVGGKAALFADRQTLWYRHLPLSLSLCHGHLVSPFTAVACSNLRHLSSISPTRNAHRFIGWWGRKPPPPSLTVRTMKLSLVCNVYCFS